MEPFEQAIREHLELQRRNAALEDSMPLARYRVDGTLDGQGLLKSEAEARLEETAERPSFERDAARHRPEEFWAPPPAFAWGE